MIIKKPFERKSAPLQDDFPNLTEGKVYHITFHGLGNVKEQYGILVYLYRKRFEDHYNPITGAVTGSCHLMTLASDSPWANSDMDLYPETIVHAVVEVQPDELPQYLHMEYKYPAFDRVMRGDWP